MLKIEYNSKKTERVGGTKIRGTTLEETNLENQ